ncbi:MAG: 30S ribosome-binding factor RbfA [Kordiimonadaceae bacterium]|nr:30S ribosome-binding factor RbfA [Kordiimonadaceae bacterium]
MSKSKHTGADGPNLRLLRVSENVRHAIATILGRGDVQDADLERVSVTVSEARVSTDFRSATIFVMPLGGDPDGVVTDALNKHASFIRGAMAKMVRMKYSPKLKFKLDLSFDEASHIEALLKTPKVLEDLAKPDEVPEDASDVDRDD